MLFYNFRKVIWICVIAIIVIGLIALFSASHQNTRVTQQVFYNQLFFSILGILAIFGLSYVDYRKYYDIAYIFYAVNVLFLIAILIFGHYALGAKRWIEVLGFNFQPSEFMKISLILALARYFTDYKPNVSFYNPWGRAAFFLDFFNPFILTAIPMLLIFKQPDLGTAILILGIFFIIVFAGGVSTRYLVGFFILCVSATPLLWYMMKSYQKDRLMVFLNPNIDPFGAGYTIIQSKIAIGSGQIFGKGWLAGTQNQLNFLPERHTDFIFSVIGEEWGFIGGLVLLSCFYLVILSGLRIVQQTKDKFGFLAGVGIVSIFSMQIIINVAMVLGLCPIVGLTLPMISYGRSSFLVSVLMLGFLLNLSKKNKIL
ncbi:MAG: rod shape-determining protein RodA [Candidatus Omnitrophica bacterium]|nr:rod shape-determining protein RodA [Candidatus Omnitrophota bacterium]